MQVAEGVGDEEEVVVETMIEAELLLVVWDWETQRTWPMDKLQFASSEGLKA